MFEHIKQIQKKTFLTLVMVIACLLPFVTPPIALTAGVIFAALGFSSSSKTKGKIIAFLLQGSIVCMGFGINLEKAMQTSQTGFFITVVSVVMTVLIGLLLGRIFKVDKPTSLLISCGTAICGGSAIAAISPVINAKTNQVTFALGVVFALNAVALIVFPVIGHALNMTQEAFGFWAAIAIHDTSSVVGAGAAFGPEALEIATTVKLTRALWIIPMSIVLALTNKTKASKIKIPWFILLFVMAIIIGHFFPQLSNIFSFVVAFGKKGLVMALFLIGTTISLNQIKKAGVGAFGLGITLWLLVCGLSLWMIL